MTAADFISAKVPQPSDMTSRDWERVQASVRGRAFFMATVLEGEILSLFQKWSVEVAAGRVNKARAREEIRLGLTRLGYKPAPGTEGSIKDLRSFRRIEVVLAANEALAAGSVAYDRALAGELLYPAKQLRRVALRKEPRNWPARFRAAAAGLEAQGVNTAELAAHVRHPVWRAISDFDLPHPPYAWGSGMGDKSVRLDTALQWGVAELPLTPPGSTEVPAQTHKAAPVLTPGLNDGLSMAAQVELPEVREAVAARLRGAAVWERAPREKKGAKEGWRLVYRDPNGASPLPPAEVPRVVRAQPEPDAPTYQADAAGRYAAEGPNSFTPGSDALYDFARLVHRVEPGAGGGGAFAPLWHAREFPGEDAAQLFISMLDDGIMPRAGWPFMECSTEAGLALADMERTRSGLIQGGVPVVFVVRGSVTGRDLRPLLRALTNAEEAVPGVFLEAGTRLRVLSVEEVRGLRTVVCEEVRA
jgi:hypothetical protein